MPRDRRNHLRTFLSRYRPEDPAEEEHRRRMLELLSFPGDPFSRHHFDPGHFTASAFVLDGSRERVLALYHRKLGRWLQPGGHVEPSDPHLLAAALREAREEVGLARLNLVAEAPEIFDLDVHPIPAFGADPAHAHFDVRFLFVTEELPMRPSPEGRAIQWVELDSAATLLSDASVLRAVGKVRRLLPESRFRTDRL